MSGLKRFRGFGGKLLIKSNQVLLINKASKIALKCGSVDGEVYLDVCISRCMYTSISSSISHVTDVKGEYQQEEDGRGPRSYPGGRGA